MNERKKESVAGFKAGLEALPKVTQPALAALFVSGLSPEISGSLKRQNMWWEGTHLTELVTITEHLKELWTKTINQGPPSYSPYSDNSSKARHATPYPPSWHPPGAPPSKHRPKDWCLRCKQLGHWKRLSSKALTNTVTSTQMPLHLPLEECPPWAPPKVDGILRDFL